MAIKDSIKSNLQVQVVRTVKVNMTGNDWQLYTSSMDCSKAVAYLNDALETAVNSGKTRQEVYAIVEAAQHKMRRYGASDTEGRYALHDALDAIFGEDGKDY